MNKVLLSYDCPLNEYIRMLLRLENLFIKMLHSIDVRAPLDYHSALFSLFKILDVIDRHNLKNDLLQELNRQIILMTNFQGNPAISEKILSDLLKDIKATALTLNADAIKLGQALHNNQWLMNIKQRSDAPGGVCGSDVPSYHYWLELDEARRAEDFGIWLQPLMPINDAVHHILHILRGSGATTKLLAASGSYQQTLYSAKPAQMLRIEVDNSLACFPEVTANKHAIHVRFNSLGPTQIPQPCNFDVPFSLTLCNL